MDRAKASPRLHGKGRNSLSAWLQNSWLRNGPPIRIVQGAPGVGKTAVARVLAPRGQRPTVLVDYPRTESEEVNDLNLDGEADAFLFVPDPLDSRDGQKPE